MTVPQQPYVPPPQGQPYVPPVYAPVPQYLYQPAAQPGANGLAIAGLVLGIVGLVLFWVPGLGLLLGILAIVFGGIGLHKATRTESGKGIAVAGLTLGIITVLLAVLIWIVAVAAGAG